jgi:hypothetical protein
MGASEGESAEGCGVLREVVVVVVLSAGATLYLSRVECVRACSRVAAARLQHPGVRSPSLGPSILHVSRSCRSGKDARRYSAAPSCCCCFHLSFFFCACCPFYLEYLVAHSHLASDRLCSAAHPDSWLHTFRRPSRGPGVSTPAQSASGPSHHPEAISRRPRKPHGHSPSTAQEVGCCAAQSNEASLRSDQRRHQSARRRRIRTAARPREQRRLRRRPCPPGS